VKRCRYCNKISKTISKNIGFCADCIRNYFDVIYEDIIQLHKTVRKKSGIPEHTPHDSKGRMCQFCFHNCKLDTDKIGLCGVRRNEEGHLKGGTPRDGNLFWYYDPLPTNCVAEWVCAGCTAEGFPEFSYTKTPEYGYKNLAVFYNSCSFNCLFCQNWHYRNEMKKNIRISSEELASKVDDKTSCICFFGGDPSTQIAHAIKTSFIALKNKKDRILRICWETNGSMNTKFLDIIWDLSIQSGGCIKFDLKAWTQEIHLALCGVTNKMTLENFKILASRFKDRPSPAPLIASTLLVPGYIDTYEVSKIAHFIASINPNIPYTLLAFHPEFYMDDLPSTSYRHAMDCLNAAKDEGLNRVRVANEHLLGNWY